MKRLLSPNFWVGILCVIALGGLACVVLGMINENDQLVTVGKWLIAPLVVGGILLVLIGIPILIQANRRLK